MPRKRKVQPKRKPAGRRRSSQARNILDLRSIFEERFAEARSKVAWCEDQTKELSAAESGPQLNEAVIAALAEIRLLIPEFIRRLYAIGLTKKQVRSESEKALRSFITICAPFASSNDMEQLLRNALAEGPGRPVIAPFPQMPIIFQRIPIKPEEKSAKAAKILP